MFDVGDRVKLKEGGEVLLEGRRGSHYWGRWDNGTADVVRVDEILLKVDARPKPIWEALEEGLQSPQIPGDPAAFVAAVKVRRKIKHLPTFGSINAIPYTFQYTPLFAMRRSPFGRILVADETGLGKTLEAGIIIEELMHSSNLAEQIQDVLVVAPKNLEGEWETKLLKHFKRPIKGVDAKWLLNRLNSEEPPEKVEAIYFISMDALYRVLEELGTTAAKRAKGGRRVPLANLFDLVVVDEAHHFKNADAKRRRALALILGHDALEDHAPGQVLPKLPKAILLTATPLSTDLGNLQSYFTLLDPELGLIDGESRQSEAFNSEHRMVVRSRQLANRALRAFASPKEKSLRDNLRKELLAMESHVRIKGTGALIFGQFLPTAGYLKLRLEREDALKDVRIEFLHGGIPPSTRREMIDELKVHDGALILILTEVGQEGIDLQFCTGVFHYDLPWNPMRLVQRNGRVHRIGQVAPEVFIHSYYVEDSLDDRISEAIGRRMKLVYDTFGDLPDGLLGGDLSLGLAQHLSGMTGFHIVQSIKGRDLTAAEVFEDMTKQVDRWNEETNLIQVHRDQIRKVLADDSEACQAWRPLVEDAVHGSFGSVERVLGQDIEAMLRWNTRANSGLSARQDEQDPSLWDVRWNNFPFEEDTGALGREARRKLRDLNEMVAQILPDEGEGRRQGFEPHQVLHLAHPLVAQMAKVTHQSFPQPLLFVASRHADRPSALVCVDFEVEDLGKGQSHTDSRWFLLEPHGSSKKIAWQRIPQQGSADRIRAILEDVHPWREISEESARDWRTGILEGLYDLHSQIREEVLLGNIRRRRKQLLRRLRQLGKAHAWWSKTLNEQIAQERLHTGHLDALEAMGYGRDSLDRQTSQKALSIAKGQITRAKNQQASLEVDIQKLLEEEEALRAGSATGIRVKIHENTPHAVLVIQPTGR